MWWQDHETREVSLRFDSVADFAAYREAKAEADEDEDEDDIAARFRPRCTWLDVARQASAGLGSRR
ncbi:hypothetical protein SAMN02745121_01174 [Nannocystis exedens]|uniref:Uncharacterized protein n=1 Tax=Nannocystis exedens TaxID=54 RepID=A0A1I1UE24_9BACT|nr:hypothetical protein [Nannocystis exedens]PCC71631.1 hypothetical protein NAEX_04708 [Nannocystis exedens]SFD68954.1 hypothetical protein SAMN02745121_01174 [Nannocystis exedens]